MKRDMDLVRDLLLQIEESTQASAAMLKSKQGITSRT
ncbi:DUF2513 domain-containing protein [Rhizobium leguminosarum]|nr:DUF2513 domain-containing protein [Rhizobium leguminosarum]